MTGSIVNRRYGLIVIHGDDSQQYYYTPDRTSDDVGAEALPIGTAVRFEVSGLEARDLVVTGQAFDPGTEGWA